MKKFTLQEIENIRLRKYTSINNVRSYGMAVTDESFKVCRRLFDIERNEYMKGLSGEEPTGAWELIVPDLPYSDDVEDFMDVVNEILTRAYNAGRNNEHYEYRFRG
jgi:hypothetical protein